MDVTPATPRRVREKPVEEEARKPFYAFSPKIFRKKD